MDEALKLFNEKLEFVGSLINVWQFNETEDWLVSTIIGKNGRTIQKFRKETNCTIDIDSKLNRMILSATDKDTILKGISILDEFITKSRNECIFVHLSEQDLPAFVGKSGKNLKEFIEKHEVEVQIIKKKNSAIRITGDETKVTTAKLSLENWIMSRAELRKDAEGEITKEVKRKDIPTIIGTKGETIRGLQREFGCKVTVDRATFTICVSGGTSLKRSALMEKIDKIITERAEDASSGKQEMNETEITYVGDVVDEFETVSSNILNQVD